MPEDYALQHALNLVGSALSVHATDGRNGQRGGVIGVESATSQHAEALEASFVDNQFQDLCSILTSISTTSQRLVDNLRVRASIRATSNANLSCVSPTMSNNAVHQPQPDARFECCIGYLSQSCALAAITALQLQRRRISICNSLCASVCYIQNAKRGHCNRLIRLLLTRQRHRYLWSMMRHLLHRKFFPT